MNDEPIKELEKRLAKMNAKIESMLGKPGWTTEIALAAYDEQAQTERLLAAAKGEAYANPVDVGCTPSIAGSSEVFLQSECSSALVVFRAVVRAQDSKARYCDAGWAIARLRHCVQSKFGYPNDEAFPGHALYGKGFSCCGVYEVVNSDWDELLRKQNRIAFPNSELCPWNLRHLVFAFKENVLECLVREFQVEITNRSLDQILTEETRRIL